MEYKLQIKPFEHTDGGKYKIIQITDIALHTAKKNPTPSVGKKIQKAFDANKPDRIYSRIEKTAESDDKKITLELLKMDPDFVRMVEEEESKGYKVLIALPNKGIPVFPGKDTVEFMNSKNGKRLIRGLAKENDKE
ncbi:MAG: hypothetical protein ABIO57_01640 [Candidatus Paceibacterota bacterium]